MGADIHMYVEKKLPAGEWVTVQTFEPASKQAFGMEGEAGWSSSLFWQIEGRFYRLFAKLAGVRGEGPEPLGIPDDASSLYRHYCKQWSGDGHSHSYCSAATFIQRYIEAVEEQNPSREGTSSQIVKAYAEDVLKLGSAIAISKFLETYCAVSTEEDDNVDNYRFVFFFDN
jgi:hypothetical protein